MGELRTLRRLIFGEWNYQRTHGFGAYLFSEDLDMLCPVYCLSRTREISPEAVTSSIFA